MADLVADINEAEQKTLQAQKTTSDHQQKKATESLMGFETIASYEYKTSTHGITTSGPVEDVLPPPPLESELDFPLLPPPPPPPAPEPLTQVRVNETSSQPSLHILLQSCK